MTAPFAKLSACAFAALSLSACVSAPSGPSVLVLPGSHAGTEQAYDVLVPAYLREGLASRAGGIVTLYTIQSFESPDGGSSFAPRLIGFTTPDERRFFELLTTVKGVGTKKALRALASPVGDVARAITLRDAIRDAETEAP